MSMEERTLVVRNIDGDKLTTDLLEELFVNFGPLVRVVLRPTFAFIEYTKKESVGFAWAMMDGIYFQGNMLRIAPKIQCDPSYRIYKDRLRDYENQLINNEAFIDALLTPEQIKEKNHLISKLKSSSSSTASSARRRFRRYQRHYEPRSTFNHILGKDLSDGRQSSRDRHTDRHRTRERSRSFDRNNNRDDYRHRPQRDLRDILKANRSSSNNRSHCDEPDRHHNDHARDRHRDPHPKYKERRNDNRHHRDRSYYR